MGKHNESDESQGPQNHGARDPIDESVKLGMRAFQAAINLQWDTAKKLNEEAQAKAKTLEGREGELARGVIGALTTMNEGLMLQFRDTDPERLQRSVQRLDEALDRLQELRNHFPHETANEHFESMVTSIEMQAIWAARRIAREQGDRQQVLIRDAQVRALIDTVPEPYKNQVQGVVATQHYIEIMGRFKESTAALAIMDLARALRIITEVREEGDATLNVIKQSLGRGVLFESIEQVLSGVYQCAEALEGYVRALHDAVAGDVTRAHVDQLTRAEELLRSGAKKMVEGRMIVNHLSEKDAKVFAASFEGPISLVRNLRTLCHESLKPKRWIASASLKFVLVFLATVVVLVAVVASTNGDGLSGGILTGYILLVSFVAGLIGGFGFDALRFLPFAKLLSKLRPAAQKPSNESADT